MHSVNGYISEKNKNTPPSESLLRVDLKLIMHDTSAYIAGLWKHLDSVQVKIYEKGLIKWWIQILLLLSFKKHHKIKFFFVFFCFVFERQRELRNSKT